MFIYHTKVSASQIGPDGFQTLFSLVQTMQDASQFSFDGESPMGDYLRENEMTYMLVSRQVDIMRYPAYGEALELSTGIYESKPVMGFRATEMRDNNGELLAQSWSAGAVVSLRTGKLARIPREIIETMNLVPKTDMDFQGRRIDPPETEPIKQSTIIARPSDIDYNQHVNNVQYIRMACDCLPLDYKPKRLRIEYKAQAKLGDTLYPFVFEPVDDIRCIQLMGEDSKPFVNVEFS